MSGVRAATAVLVTFAVLLTGCAGSGGRPSSASAGTAAADSGVGSPMGSTDPFGCGIVVTPEQAVVGEDVTISRPATEPSEICTTLAPGTVQTLELRSVFVSDRARQTTTVTVDDDGSFTATMPVPTDIRLDNAVVTAIPPAESDCTDAAAAAGTPDDCYFPEARFTVEFAPDDLSSLQIVSTDVTMPTLSSHDAEQDSFALAGPGPNELTVVIFGSGCASRPAGYRHDAPAGSLEIVSEVIVPAGQDGCNEPRIPWTTVITVPDGHRDYTAVTVDNLDTVLLG